MSDRALAAENLESTGESYWREWIVFLLAAATTAGSIFLSVGMSPKLSACPLCFYQRTFVMSIMAVLLIGLLQRGSSRPGALLYVCLPLSFGGLGVAAYHVYLESSGKLVCPLGVLKMGTAPQQSLAAYVLLTVVLLLFVPRRSGSALALMTSACLGVAMSWLCIWSAPAMPKPDPKDEGLTSDKAVICKPVYHRSEN